LGSAVTTEMSFFDILSILAERNILNYNVITFLNLAANSNFDSYYFLKSLGFTKDVDFIFDSFKVTLD